MLAEVQGVEHRIGPVDLVVPASSEHLRVLRLVTSSLAASLGLDVDQLDDLRTAVDELCCLLIERSRPEARLCLRLRDDQGHLFAEGALLDDRTILTIDPVSQLILDGLDIEWNIDQPSSFWLVSPARRDGSG